MFAIALLRVLAQGNENLGCKCGGYFKNNFCCNWKILFLILDTKLPTLMKPILTVLLLLLFCYSYAQDDSTGRIACIILNFCNRDLRNPISGLSTIGAIKEKDECYARNQNCSIVNSNTPTYHDVSYANYNGSDCTLPDDCIEVPGALKYHVFYPSDRLYHLQTACSYLFSWRQFC